jgi:hypothetical protein
MATGSRQGVQDERVADLAIDFSAKPVSKLLKAYLIILLANLLLCALSGTFIDDLCCCRGKPAVPGKEVQPPQPPSLAETSTLSLYRVCFLLMDLPANNATAVVRVPRRFGTRHRTC